MQENRAEGGAGAGLRILIADSLPQRAVDDLEARGHECVVDSSLGGADLAEHIQGFDVLVNPTGDQLKVLVSPTKSD